MYAFRRAALCALLTATVVLNGCAYLYRADDDKAAQQVSKAYTEADYGNSLQAERTALGKRQQERQEIVKRNELALRDARLARIIGGTGAEYTWGAMKIWVDARLAFVRGPKAMGMPDRCGSSIEELRSDHAFNQNRSALARDHLLIAIAAHGEKVEISCSKPVSLPAKSAGDGNVRALAKQFEQTCSVLNTTTGCLATIQKSGGELVRVANQIDAIKAENETIGTLIENIKKEYDKALADADTKKPTEGVAKATAKTLEDVLKKFDAVAAKAAEVRDNPVISGLVEKAKIEKLEKQKAVLEGYISALSGKEPEKASLSQHRAYLVANLVNKATEKPAPPTAGIILQAEIYRQQIEAAKARLARAERSIHLLELKKNALTDELGFLQQVEAERARLDKARCNTKTEAFSATFTNAKTPEVCRLGATRALLAFSNAWTLGKAQSELIDYRLIDEQESAALEESEIAIKQHDTVMKAALDQITKLHASGLKPEQIAAMVQAIGVSVIAVRVK